MSDDTMAKAPSSLPPLQAAATFNGGLKGNIKAEVSLGPVPPRPPDDKWHDWDLLKVLRVSYWGIKIVHVLGQMLGLFREPTLYRAGTSGSRWRGLKSQQQEN